VSYYRTIFYTITLLIILGHGIIHAQDSMDGKTKLKVNEANEKADADQSKASDAPTDSPSNIAKEGDANSESSSTSTQNDTNSGSQNAESQNAESQNAESQNAESQNAESQNAESQNAESQSDKTQSDKTSTEAEDQTDSTENAQLSLNYFLNQIAIDGSIPLSPDIRNGLIRVAALTVQGAELDLATRELITLLLSKKIAQQSNMVITEPKQVYRMMRTFTVQDLALSDGRALTLGRMLGVRFLFVTHVTAEGSQYRFKVKVLSIKRKGVVFENEAMINRSDINQLQKDHIFREKKSSALWRSLLLPGWGQFYQHRPHMGTLYTLTSLGLLIGGILSYQDGQTWSDLYQEKTASTVPYRHRANQAFSRANIFWGALATTWVISALDAYLTGEDQAKSRINITVYPQGGLQLSSSF
jgi:hypothetical protein